MGKKGYSNKTEYEKVLEFNVLVSWLHSYRYKNIIEVFDGLAKVVDERPIKVLDLGCAHAKLFGLLNKKFSIEYIGIEIIGTFVDTARERYSSFPNFSVIQGSAIELVEEIGAPDIIVALEMLEHIPEHDVVRLVEHISKVRPRLFVCSVPVELGPAIWLKNIGSLLTGYMRHREYRWSETFWAGLYQLHKLPAHGTGHKGFDWRWLAQTIRYKMVISEIRTFPFRFLPAALSTSVFMIAKGRER